MIRSRGIEISDMRQYLANKKRDRAALLGGENGDSKSKSAVAHTQPITRFLQSTHTEVLEGITGRVETQGMQTSAAKGISMNLCDKK